MRSFTAIGSTGSRFALLLTSERRGGKPYLVTTGAAAYVADVLSGVCVGVDGSVGQTVTLVPDARRRLAAIVRSETG